MCGDGVPSSFPYPTRLTQTNKTMAFSCLKRQRQQDLEDKDLDDTDYTDDAGELEDVFSVMPRGWVVDPEGLKLKLQNLTAAITELQCAHRCVLDVRINNVQVCKTELAGPLTVTWTKTYPRGDISPRVYVDVEDIEKQHPDAFVSNYHVLSKQGKRLGALGCSYEQFGELHPLPESRVQPAACPSGPSTAVVE